MNSPSQNGIIHDLAFKFLLLCPMKYKETAICKLKWNYTDVHVSLYLVIFMFLHGLLHHESCVQYFFYHTEKSTLLP